MKVEQNLHWGDQPHTKQNETCRILFSNVNGISAEKGYRDAHELGASAKELQVDVLGLAETNLDWSKLGTEEGYKNAIRRHCTRSKHAFSCSKLKFKSMYQPGGTATTVTNKWVGCATTMKDTSRLG